MLSSCATTESGTGQRGSAPNCQLRYAQASPQNPGAPPKAMVVATMQTVKRDVMGCYDRYKQQGTVLTCVDVAADGTVEHVDSEGDLVGSDQAQCIKTAVQSAKFAPHDAPWSMKYPYVFR
jgi:hypothetical protein